MTDHDAAELRLEDFDEDEQLALGALVRRLAAAADPPGGLDDEALAAQAEALGVRLFWGCLDRAEAQDVAGDALQRLVVSLERRAACELIYVTLFELAASTGVSRAQDALLTELVDSWGLDPRRLAGPYRS